MPGRIWLGDVEVRPDNNEIVVRGLVVRLKPQVMQVRQCLISAASAVVTRSGILDEVWPNVTVSESVVSAKIRRIGTFATGLLRS